MNQSGRDARSVRVSEAEAPARRADWDKEKPLSRENRRRFLRAATLLAAVEVCPGCDRRMARLGAADPDGRKAVWQSHELSAPGGNPFFVFRSIFRGCVRRCPIVRCSKRRGVTEAATFRHC